MVLIVTNSSDATADYFVESLKSLKQPYFRFDTDRLLDSYIFDYQQNESLSNLQIEDKVTCKSVNSKMVTGIWYRRPVFPQVNVDNADQELRRELARELRCQYESFLRGIESAVWVSLPERLRFAEDRLVQLRRAARIGFSTPDTLITNSRRAASRFLESHDRTCTKPLHLGQVLIEDDLYLFHTAIVAADDYVFLERVSNFPVLLQHYLEKRIELRLTVVHDRVFPVEIVSSLGTDGAIDWRVENGTQVDFKPASISPELSDLAVKLLREFGLEFAAMDVLLSDDGQYYFLDLNPNGQWAWLDKQLGLGIAEELSKYLSGGG